MYSTLSRTLKTSNGFLMSWYVHLFDFRFCCPYRHTCMAETPDSRKARRLLHLTPVRRSTRKNRNGPGLTMDQSMCFDSPSEAKGSEEYGEVEIVPNRALILTESKAFNTDRADNWRICNGALREPSQESHNTSFPLFFTSHNVNCCNTLHL